MINLKRKLFFAALPVLAGIVIWLVTNDSDTGIKDSLIQAKLPKSIDNRSNNIDHQTTIAGTKSRSNDDNAVTSYSTFGITEQANSGSTEVQNKLAIIEEELRKLQDNMNELMSKAESQPELTSDPALQKQIQDMSDQREQLAYEYMESTFIGEAIDPAWEAEANSKISEGLAKIENLTSSVIECATTMCRINAVTSGNDKDAMEIMHSLDSELSWEGQMYITVNHQSGEMTAYLARPGNTLPQATN
ncbi:hypothetical protein [Kaarinaea lacus]